MLNGKEDNEEIELLMLSENNELSYYSIWIERSLGLIFGQRISILFKFSYSISY